MDNKWWLTASDFDIKKWFQQDLTDRVYKNLSGYWPNLPSRVIAIGDIHGDWHVCLQVLHIAGVIESPENPNWTGGNTWIVQCGDILDRRSRRSQEKYGTNQLAENDEGNELRIMGFLANLADQAQQQGGNVLAVLGNHEWWNLSLFNYTYTTPKSRKVFLEEGNVNNLQHALQRRQEAFKPGGWLARWIGRNRYWLVQLGPWVFVHGSFFGHPENIESMIRRQQLLINVTRKVLPQSRDDIEIALRTFLFQLSLSQGQKDLLSRVYPLLTEDRTYGFTVEEHINQSFKQLNFYKQHTERSTVSKANMQEIKNKELLYQPVRCQRLRESLEYFNANFLVVAHTPHQQISSDCDGHLWRIDLGLSQAFEGIFPPPKYLGFLEITNGNPVPVQTVLDQSTGLKRKRNNQNNKNQKGDQKQFQNRSSQPRIV